MEWDNRDIHNPHLYAPRPYPHVQKADALQQYADADKRRLEEGVWQPQTEGFVFDEPLVWDSALAGVDILPALHKPVTTRLEQQVSRTMPGMPSGGNAAYGHAPHAKVQKRKNIAQKRKNKKGHPYLYVSTITVCVFFLSLIAVMMMPQVGGYFWRDLDNYAFINGKTLRYDKELVATYKQYREYMQKDAIFPGVFVDGIHVGEMTIAEAEQVLTGEGAAASKQFSVTVAIGNKTWTFDNRNIPATRDLGNVLERAYAVGRTNTTAISETPYTPFYERVQTALALRENHKNLEAAVAYDHEAVRRQVDEIVQYVTRQPVNAQVQSFDFITRSFAFVDEQIGTTIDGEALFEEVTAGLEQWQNGVTIAVDPIVSQPAITKAMLEDSFQMMAAYTTDTTSESNRNNNIHLACQAINGTVLMPGETFSFNKATGQRTIEKGYREAGAIAGGQSIEEVGGGICQASSTLFNAVARTNLEIVSRSPHAWPVAYVKQGEDAAVNWPNLDFQFKNSTQAPVFVITYYKDRKMSAEIWGLTLGEGITIDLQSQLVRTIDPPQDTNYVQNPNLPYGTEKETIKRRTGYVVDTYRVWRQNGEEIKREKMHTSTYRAYQQTIEYN